MSPQFILRAFLFKYDISNVDQETTNGGYDITDVSYAFSIGVHETIYGGYEVTNGGYDFSIGVHEIADGGYDITDGSYDFSIGVHETTDGDYDITDGGHTFTFGNHKVEYNPKKISTIIFNLQIDDLKKSDLSAKSARDYIPIKKTFPEI